MIVRNKPYYFIYQRQNANFKGLMKSDEGTLNGIEKPCFVTDKKPFIDFNSLDKQKTYVGLQYGPGISSKIIRLFTRQYCPNHDIPIHVFCFANNGEDWLIYQSCYRANPRLGTFPGASKSKAEEWAISRRNHRKKCEVFEVDVNIAPLEENIGVKYGLKDVLKLGKAILLGRNGKQQDSPGVLCSEYIALGIDNICKFYNIPSWCITPAHFKDYFIQNGIATVIRYKGKALS